MIYLDHAATTRPAEAVLAEMLRVSRESWANPSAAYSAAGDARRVLRQARQAVAELLDCPPEQVIFTSGGTESNNWALSRAAGRHVVLSAQEHHSVLRAAKRLNCRVTLVRPDSRGVVTPEAVEQALQPDTALISVQWANNETGVLQPVEEIGALARKRGIPYHTDAVQAFGHVPTRCGGWDLLSLSAHKLYGPRGVGCLVIREGVRVSPLLSGGGQEMGLRSGTENIPGIAGLGKAAELAASELERERLRLSRLMEDFLGQVHRLLPQAQVLGEAASRLPGIAALYLPGVNAEAVMTALELRGILVSAGAACAARDPAPSHVYQALGLTEKQAGSVIRISPGRETTPEMMNTAAQTLKDILTIIQK